MALLQGLSFCASISAAPSPSLRSWLRRSVLRERGRERQDQISAIRRQKSGAHLVRIFHTLRSRRSARCSGELCRDHRRLEGRTPVSLAGRLFFPAVFLYPNRPAPTSIIHNEYTGRTLGSSSLTCATCICPPIPLPQCIIRPWCPGLVVREKRESGENVEQICRSELKLVEFGL